MGGAGGGGAITTDPNAVNKKNMNVSGTEVRVSLDYVGYGHREEEQCGGRYHPNPIHPDAIPPKDDGHHQQQRQQHPAENTGRKGGAATELGDKMEVGGTIGIGTK